MQRSAVWESEWTLWQDARVKAPHMVRPHVKVGVLLRERGDYRGALRSYGQALTIDPEHAPALNNAGNAYRSLGDRVQAQAAYEQALALWPQYVDAMINLATLHSEAGAYAESNRLFQKALETGSNRAELHNNLGTNYLRMGDYRSAEEALRAALELAHSSPRILFNLGGALEGMERYEEAREQFVGGGCDGLNLCGRLCKIGRPMPARWGPALCSGKLCFLSPPLARGRSRGRRRSTKAQSAVLREAIGLAMSAVKILRTAPFLTRYLSLAFITCLVYANALENPFHYDDFHSIVHNERLRSLSAVPQFFTDATAFSSEAENAMYRPLLLATFAANYAISQYQTWSYHLLSLVLHLACVGLVAAIGLRLLGQTLGAWWAALLFAIHPINTEPLNYISSRSEILSGLFFLLAFWVYLQAGQKGRVPWGWAMGAYALALLSKSIAIVLPAMLVVHAVLFGSLYRRETKRLVAGLALIGAAYIVGVWQFIARATIDQPVRGYDEQIWTQVKALVFYVKMLIWPSGQSIDHQFLVSDSPFDPIAAPAFALLLSLLFVALRYRREHPILAFSYAWFLLVLAPSSVVPLNVLVNEHRLYIPGLGVYWILGYGLNLLCIRWYRYRFRLSVIALLIAQYYAGSLCSAMPYGPVR